MSHSSPLNTKTNNPFAMNNANAVRAAASGTTCSDSTVPSGPSTRPPLKPASGPVSPSVSVM